MNADHRKELGDQARVDGRRLFNVSESLYNGLILMNYLLAVVGVFAGIVLMAQSSRGSLIGLIVLAVTAIFCTINYFVAVLSTHTTKVLAHMSLAMIALMESRYETDDSATQVSAR